MQDGDDGIHVGLFGDDQIDHAKVDQALAFLASRKGVLRESTLELALEVGDYLFDEFFYGRPSAYADRGSRSPSFRSLLAHPDVDVLGVSPNTLRNYIRVAIQARHYLPPELAREPSLGLGQRIALLPTRKPADVRRIAERAAREELSFREVQELVKVANATDAKGAGRAPTPEAFKAVLAVREAVRRLAVTDLSEVSWEDLGSVESVLESATMELADESRRVADEVAGRPESESDVPPVGCSPESLDRMLDELLEPTEAAAGIQERLDAARDEEALSELIEWVLEDAERVLGVAEVRGGDAHRVPGVLSRWDALLQQSEDVGLPNPYREKRRQSWYGILTHKRVVPALIDTSEPGLSVLDPDRVCILKARNKELAREMYCARTGEDPSLVVVHHLSQYRDEWEIKVPLGQYTGLPPGRRFPTLDELVEESARQEP